MGPVEAWRNWSNCRVLWVNLLLPMLVGGLWHGAAWNFVIWGGLHGVLLVVHRASSGRPRHHDSAIRGGDALRIFLCFHAVCLLWIFFRAETFTDAMAILDRLFTGSYRVDWPVLPALVVLLCGLLHFAERLLRPRLPAVRAALGEGALGGALEGAALGIIAALVVAASGVGAEFIYFQF